MTVTKKKDGEFTIPNNKKPPSLNKAYDTAGKEVLYNILIEFGVPMKIVRLTIMC
jgi:hypothetical protein